jgi:hypothetical protein
MKETAEAYLGKKSHPRRCHCSCLFQWCSTSSYKRCRSHCWSRCYENY